MINIRELNFGRWNGVVDAQKQEEAIELRMDSAGEWWQKPLLWVALSLLSFTDSSLYNFIFFKHEREREWETRERVLEMLKGGWRVFIAAVDLGGVTQEGATNNISKQYCIIKKY